MLELFDKKGNRLNYLHTYSCARNFCCVRRLILIFKDENLWLKARKGIKENSFLTKLTLSGSTEFRSKKH